MIAEPLSDELFFRPRNVGDVAEPSGSAATGSFTCGATLRVSFRVDEEQVVREARFRAAGCSQLVAACSFLTETIQGLTIGNAAALLQTWENVDPNGAGFAIRDCIELPRDALLTAIQEHSDAVREEWAGEEALVCSCFGVSESTIEGEIEAQSLSTVEEVVATCRAGAGCRSCWPLIEDILRSRSFHQ